jgi:hypothetical protein
MSIPTECINLITPIEVIKQKYPGRWNACLKNPKNILSTVDWHDDCLFRTVAMNHYDIETLVQERESYGFQLTANDHHPKKYLDMCIYQNFSGYSFQCDWLINNGRRSVRHMDDLTQRLPSSKEQMKLPIQDGKDSTPKS